MLNQELYPQAEAVEKRSPLRSVPFLLITASICLTVCAFLLTEHVRAVTHVRANTVPLLSQVPSLERRMVVLQEQLELSELNAALKIGSSKEQVEAYVLPDHIDLSRILSTIDLLRTTWIEQGVIGDLSPVDLGEHQKIDGMAAQHLSLNFSTTESYLNSVLDLFQYAGLLTVSDALTTSQRQHLLIACEEENPAAIAALEQFLSTDLLSYVRDPRAHRDMLLRSFGNGVFTSLLRDTIEQSRIPDLQDALGGSVGVKLAEHNLWPLPYLRLKNIAIRKGGSDGWVRVNLEIVALGME